MIKMLHRVASLTLILIATNLTTCLPAVTAAGVVAEMAAEYFKKTADYETNTNRLDELLTAGDFGELIQALKAVIQGKPSPQRMDFLAWLYNHRHVSPLDYLYFSSRAGNPGTISLPIAQDDLHTIHLFCLNFYIHSLLWIRIQKKANTLTVANLIAEKTRIQDIFNKIKVRIQHWLETYKAAGFLAYPAVYAHTLKNLPAGASNPLWTLGVTRDDGTLHTVGNTLKGIPFVGRFLGEPTGGLVFTTPDPGRTAIYSTVSQGRLNRWYRKAMLSLCKWLEGVSTWEELFSGAALNEWLEYITDKRKPFMRRARPARSASGAGAGCALDGRRSSHTAEDGSVAGDEVYVDGFCPTCHRAADQQNSDECPTEEEVDEDEAPSDGEGGSVASAGRGLVTLSLGTPGGPGAASTAASPGGASAGGDGKPKRTLVGGRK